MQGIRGAGTVALSFVTVREGTKYGPEYTQALRNQVPGLICLGDDQPFRSGLRGWLAKIEVFAPWNDGLRPCLCIDLDTFVVGNLAPFRELDLSRLWLIDDFNHPQTGETGLFIAPKDSSYIWAGHETLPNTDGEYLRQFPHNRLNRSIDGIFSYKIHCREAPPGNARIICFHGKPKPADTEGWAKDYWNTLISPTQN